jgi:hypothetical protein
MLMPRAGDALKLIKNVATMIEADAVNNRPPSSEP